MENLSWYIQVQTLYIIFKAYWVRLQHWKSCVSDRRAVCMTGGASCLINLSDAFQRYESAISGYKNTRCIPEQIQKKLNMRMHDTLNTSADKQT